MGTLAYVPDAMSCGAAYAGAFAAAALRRFRRAGAAGGWPRPSGSRDGLRRIGPAVRPVVARSIARATAGGSGTRRPCRPCRALAAPGDVDLAEVIDVGAGGLEDPQPEQCEHRYQGVVVGVG